MWRPWWLEEPCEFRMITTYYWSDEWMHLFVSVCWQAYTCVFYEEVVSGFIRTVRRVFPGFLFFFLLGCGVCVCVCGMFLVQ